MKINLNARDTNVTGIGAGLKIPPGCGFDEKSLQKLVFVHLALELDIQIGNMLGSLNQDPAWDSACLEATDLLLRAVFCLHLFLTVAKPKNRLNWSQILISSSLNRKQAQMGHGFIIDRETSQMSQLGCQQSDSEPLNAGKKQELHQALVEGSQRVKLLACKIQKHKGKLSDLFSDITEELSGLIAHLSNFTEIDLQGIGHIQDRLQQISLKNHGKLLQTVSELHSSKKVDFLGVPHGLWVDEPLELQKIIRSCFENPLRKKFPHFWQNFDPDLKGSLDLLSEDSEYILERLCPSIIQKFNQKNIKLLETEYFYQNLNDDPEGQPVDVCAYLTEIKNCKWHGPQIPEHRKCYNFLAINHSGDNQFTVLLQVYIQNTTDQ